MGWVLLSESDKLLVRYLLGDLSPQQRETLEREWFTSDEAWNALKAAENDLIDAYARNGLSQQDRAQFERHFLASPYMRQRVNFALALRKTGRKGGGPRVLDSSGSRPSWAVLGLNRLSGLSSGRRIVLGLAGILAATFVSLSLLQIHRQHSELVITHSDRDELQRKVDQLQRSGASSSGSLASSADTVSILVRPHLLRDGESDAASRILRIPPGTPFVNLVFAVEHGEYADYEIIVSPAGDRPVVRHKGLKIRSNPNGVNVIELHLAADLLPTADFVATLRGRDAHGKWEVADSYEFSVSR